MPSTASPAAFVEQARARVEEALDRYLPKPPACPPLVSEAMRYSVFAGGKRLRPLLTLAAADAVSTLTGPSSRPGRETAPDSNMLAEPFFRLAVEDALPAACAIELIHTYSLIHDDLPAMDDDTLRRGRPTLHVVYGDGVAILAGDGLQAEAFALLAREPSGIDGDIAGRKLRVLELIAEAAGPTGMVGGQAIDLQAGGQAPGRGVSLDADGLRAMHAKKTGALIRASAAGGAIMAGADRRMEAAISSWAGEIGLAFQIVDDILDVEGNAEKLGKTAGKDAARDKPTYPALFGLSRSRVMAEECAERARLILGNVGLAGTLLQAMADWVVSRTN